MGQQAALVLVRGQRGAGKTTRLAELATGRRADGPGVVRVECRPDAPRWDLYCAQATLAAFRDVFDEIGDSRLAAAMAAADRLCVPDTYSSTRDRAALFTELVRLFEYLRDAGPGAVFIDDVDASPAPVLAVAAAQQAGCTVVMACCGDRDGDRDAALSSAADQIIDLGPVPMDRIAALSGARLDEAVLPALRTALGPLSGNPGTVLSTVEELCRTGGLVEFDGCLCLTDPQLPALPTNHFLVREVLRQGDVAPQLIAVVAGAFRFRTDDLPAFAAAVGKDVADCGTAVDLLVASEALNCDDRGILSIACPALATTVLAMMGADIVPRLHGAIAEHVLRQGDAPDTLTDHVALAGPALPPSPVFAELLLRPADRALPVLPEAAARWYRAALRHVGDDARHTQVLNGLLRLLVRLGDYAALAEVLSSLDGCLTAELAAATALAAVHTGQWSLADALTRDPKHQRLQTFVSRWFSGTAPLPVREVASDLAVLTGPCSHRVPAEPADEHFDVVTQFELALGEGYSEPTDGPLAACRRIVRTYLRGDWSGIPSAVRSLEMSASAPTPVHAVARLLLAEVSSALGDSQRGAEWLERAGERPFIALSTWVAMGIAYRQGEWDQARCLGWDGYARVAGTTGGCELLGLSWLLVRIAFVEWEAKNHESLARLSVEARRWREQLGGTGIEAADLIVRALSERDYTSATMAVHLLRDYGSRSELMRACMTAAFLADEPRPWYHEAYEIAGRLGGNLQKATVHASMTGSGIARPRQSGDRETLSESEQRIAELVQQGLTNRQIATSLAISEKTVANHLTRLFAKTGCRSRLDLALAALEGRLKVKSSLPTF